MAGLDYEHDREFQAASLHSILFLNPKTTVEIFHTPKNDAMRQIQLLTCDFLALKKAELDWKWAGLQRFHVFSFLFVFREELNLTKMDDKTNRQNNLKE